MLRRLRALHRLVGLSGSLCMVLLAATGFLLALKGHLGWMRPDTRVYRGPRSFEDMVHPHVALSTSLSLGLPELAEEGDVGRFEYHAGPHVYKVLSKEGYHEVQVAAEDGRVLRVGRRNDQLTEDVHDLSLFHPALRTYLLPVVGASLFTLGVTGLAMYFIPVVRRARFRRRRARPAGTSR
jgi:cytochrome b subunit of formate dehydrogenase